MAFNPGRNVGRLSIRVVPDTKKFRDDLKKQLERIARTTTMSVNVDRAKLDTTKIREDIRRQMSELKGVETDANVRVTIDKAKLKKGALRKSIQEQFDQFDDIRVKITAEIANTERFEKDVRDMVQRASRNQAKITANAFTAVASRQMSFVSRDRIVNLIVKVSEKSVASALTTLAALSGARLTWKWIDDLAQSMKNLDKTLPALLGWTTGITSLVAAVFAATSGLVGIGQGLFTILPAFLVLPGLLLNAAGSVTALVVALRGAKDELSPLKDDMSELADIIDAGFWSNARGPILDLVNGLMPQLRTSFHELSTGMGEFTAALSKAFGEELSNGRLASIFNGIAEGWRVLGTGASGFAGALVSLSNIAATYTPRLAGWFVRQANTFDAWLTAISEDGRLGAWMETAIDSMYDVWDATKGIAGVFEGLWKAADAAGSGGLRGFAQLMLDWERIVNGADFQRGLTAVFRGSSVAMTAFGDAVRAIGRLIVDLDVAFESFIGSAGNFLGGLIEGAANALKQQSVDKGLMGLSTGLITALEGILPHLPRIADTFGNFLGLLGDLAGTLLPTAAGVLADLMPAIDGIISAAQDVLPGLSEAASQIGTELGPAIADFVEAAGPVLVDALLELADALVEILPVLRELIEALADFVEAIGVWADGNKSFFDGVKEWLGYDIGAESGLKELTKLIPAKEDGKWWTVDVQVDLDTVWNNNKLDVDTKAQQIASAFMAEYQRVLEDKGQDAADALMEQMRGIDGIPKEVLDKINEQMKLGFTIIPQTDLNSSQKAAIDKSVKMISDAFKKGGADNATDVWNSWVMGTDGNKDPISPELRYWIARGVEDLGVELNNAAGGAGGGFSVSMAQGMAFGYPAIDAELQNTKAKMLGGMVDAGGLLAGVGLTTMEGYRGGLAAGVPAVTTDMANMGGILAGAMAGAAGWLTGPGISTMGGFRNGANSGVPGVMGVFNSLRGMIYGAVSGISLYGTGANIMGGLAAGMRDSSGAVEGAARNAVRNAIAGARAEAEIRSPSRKAARLIGRPFIQGVAVGIDKDARLVNQSMNRALDLSGISGKSPDLGANGSQAATGVNLHIHNPVVRDLQAEAWEAAQLAGALG